MLVLMKGVPERLGQRKELPPQRLNAQDRPQRLVVLQLDEVGYGPFTPSLAIPLEGEGSGLDHNAGGTGIDVEAVPAEEADQGYTEGAGGVDRQARWRADARDEGDPGHCCLLQ